MSEKQEGVVRLGVRFVAFLLVAGGLLGILASVQMTVHFVHEDRLDRVLVALVSIPVFAWSAVKGVDLWRGRPKGYWWAKLLFSLQIPAVCVSRVTYEFSTGMSARVLFGHSNRRFGADIGSSLNFLISPDPLGWMLGINVLAAVVVLYLFRVTGRVDQASQRLEPPPP
jgi:hypothetical protein